MKKIIFVLFLSIAMISSVKAYCSDEEVIRLSNLAKNVNASYMYDENTKRFQITFTNTTDDIAIFDFSSNKYYSSYPEITIKNFKSGKYKFYIYAKDKNCYEEELTSKYIELPFYNQYYDSIECQKFREYSYCNKWLQSNLSYDIWKQKIDEYNNIKEENIKEETIPKSVLDIIREMIIELYVNYYYIFLPLIISSLCLIIYLKDKSEQII